MIVWETDVGNEMQMGGGIVSNWYGNNDDDDARDLVGLGDKIRRGAP